MRAATLFILLALLCLCSSAARATGFEKISAADLGLGIERFALVIGNAAYQNIGPLENTVEDARAMARAMSNVGFDVTIALDVDRRGMLDAFESFLNSVTPGSEALIYYSGHGVEIEGQNYLLPTDIRDLGPNQRLTLEDDAIGLSRMLLRLEDRKARVNVVLLDACRNNPFTARGSKALGGEAGLSAVEPPQGTMVIYSAAAGETSLDRLGSSDSDPNGVFTRSLLKLVGQRGLELRELAQELKERVYETALQGASHIQRPSYYDGLIGKFYFLPPTLEPRPERTVCERLLDPNASADAILLSDTSTVVAACQQAIATAPGDEKLQNLLAIAVEQRDAQKALAADQSVYAKAYLRLYPAGRYREPVQQRLAELEPIPLPGPVPVPEPPLPEPKILPVGPELVAAIQTALGRVGCSAGAADGVWGRGSKRALAAFASAANVTIASDEPTGELLTLLSGYGDERICAVSCRATQIAQGNICVDKTCPAGQKLSSSGSCYVPKKIATTVTPVRPAKPARQAECFMFNGKQHCE